ncbi:hypothetical protein TKK_0002917 [Trichogramma kaykai]
MFSANAKITDLWDLDVLGIRDPERHYPKKLIKPRHVVKENSSTCIRPVFDASVSCNDGPSVNQCLETGPNLIELITNILLRFMRNKTGVAADIKKAFLQVQITPADRDVLKFLWWKKDSPHETIVYRHRRVVFGVNSSPFLLGATIKLHLDNALKNFTSNEEEEIIKKLKKSFYVDNCVASVQPPEEESKFRSTATEVMLHAGFDLRGWERTYDDAEKSKISILGLIWDKRNDCLLINACFTGEIKQPLTKRKILSNAQKIIDPLGWACPTLLCHKLLLYSLKGAINYLFYPLISRNTTVLIVTTSISHEYFI